MIFSLLFLALYCIIRVWKERTKTQMEIKKQKNLIILINEENKTNTIDIETGIILGKMNKPVKHLSPEMKKFCQVRNVSNDHRLIVEAIIYYLDMEVQNPTVLLRADKLASLGLRVDIDNLMYIDEKTFNEVKFNQGFVTYLKNCRGGLFSIGYWSLYQTMKDLTENEIAIFHRYSNIPNDIKGSCAELKKCLAWIAYIEEHEHISIFHDYIRMVCDYLKNAKILQKPDVFSKNFLTNYAKVQYDYDAQKDALLRVKVKENQESANLDYQNETFTIIVPIAFKEFVDEANQQQNCVRSYFPYIAEKEINIVFLRYNTDLKRSVLTLEIKNGKIVQIKAKYNNSPTSEQRLMVKAYQDYLDNK
jgi:transcriptional antiterminator Rof (Rho-off)